MRLAALALLGLFVAGYRLHAGAAELGALPVQALLELQGLLFLVAGILVARLPLLAAALVLQGLHWGGPATLLGDERLDGVPYLLVSGMLPATLELHFAWRAWRPRGTRRALLPVYTPLALAVALAPPLLLGADVVEPFLLLHGAQTCGCPLLALGLLFAARRCDPLYGRLAAVFGSTYALWLGLSLALGGEAVNLVLGLLPVGCARVVTRSAGVPPGSETQSERRGRRSVGEHGQRRDGLGARRSPKTNTSLSVLRSGSGERPGQWTRDSAPHGAPGPAPWHLAVSVVSGGAAARSSRLTALRAFA